MGTPCVIAMRNSEDSYRWIFSPYNGDIQSVGRMLFDHYDTKEKVERLLDDGDIDLLAPNVEECIRPCRRRISSRWSSVQLYAYRHAPYRHDNASRCPCVG